MHGLGSQILDRVARGGGSGSQKDEGAVRVENRVDPAAAPGRLISRHDLWAWGSVARRPGVLEHDAQHAPCLVDTCEGAMKDHGDAARHIQRGLQGRRIAESFRKAQDRVGDRDTGTTRFRGRRRAAGGLASVASAASIWSSRSSTVSMPSSGESGVSTGTKADFCSALHMRVDRICSAKVVQVGWRGSDGDTTG